MDARDITESVEFLPDKYVVYEMNIRKESLARSTCASRKRRLIAILIRESETGQPSEMTHHMRAQDDLAECLDFLSEIEVDMASGSSTSALECECRLMFLKERVERLRPSPVVAFGDLRVQIIEKIEELEKRFRNVTVSSGLERYARNITSPNGSFGFLPRLNTLSLNENSVQMPRLSSTKHPSADAQPSVLKGALTTSLRSANASHSVQPNHTVRFNESTSSERAFPTLRSAPDLDVTFESPSDNHALVNSVISSTTSKPNAQMWKWKIKFSGDGDEVLASDFIQELKDLSQSRGVTNEELLNGMPELLTGTASKWYRTANRDRPFIDFYDFAARFLEDFEPFYKVDTRLEKLRKRLQGPNEKVVAYFAHMEHEFYSMVNPPPMNEQIRIIRKNLLPQFVTHMACQTFKTVSELKTACKQIELSYEMVNAQCSSRGQETVVPYSYNTMMGTNRGQTRGNVDANRYQFPTVNPVQQSVPMSMPFQQNANRQALNQGYGGQQPPTTRNVTQQYNSQQRYNPPQQSGYFPQQLAYVPRQNVGAAQQAQSYQPPQNVSTLPSRAAPNQYNDNGQRALNSTQQNSNFAPRPPVHNTSAVPSNNGYPRQPPTDVYLSAQGGAVQRNPQNNNRHSQGYQSFTQNLNTSNGQNRSFARNYGNPPPNNQNILPPAACVSSVPTNPPNNDLIEQQVDELLASSNTLEGLDITDHSVVDMSQVCGDGDFSSEN